MLLNPFDSRACTPEHPVLGYTFRFRSRSFGFASGLVAALLLYAAAASAQPSPESRVFPASTTENPSLHQVAPFTPEQMGDALMFHKRYQAAIEEYKKAPASSHAWNQIGIACQIMLNFDGALRSYQKALKIDPSNFNAMNNLGTAYDWIKDYGRAEHMYRKALKLQPKNALVRKNLGTSLISQHKYQQGWESYQAALDLDPKIFENHVAAIVPNNAAVAERGAMNYYMAKGCVRSGRNGCALEYLRRSVSEGFVKPEKIVADRSFAVLLNLPEFQQFLAEQQAR